MPKYVLNNVKENIAYHPGRDMTKIALLIGILDHDLKNAFLDLIVTKILNEGSKHILSNPTVSHHFTLFFARRCARKITFRQYFTITCRIAQGV